MAVNVNPCAANPVEPVSFSWQANPPEDHVLGYRLYYGSVSRLDSSGRPKTNFSYDYYIDFTSLERCEPDEVTAFCENLGPEEVACQDLSGDLPSCTLYNLAGELYFSLTAYNAYAESDYTAELSMNLESGATPASSRSGFPLLRFINTILLQNRTISRHAQQKDG